MAGPLRSFIVIGTDAVCTNVVQILIRDDATALIEQLASPGGMTTVDKSEGRPWITQATIFVPGEQQNLLHLAVLYSAKHCVALLVSEPYLWDPDRTDANGVSPLRLAEMRDDLDVLVPMASYAKELRFFRTNETIPHLPRPCTMLVWPQHLWHVPLSRCCMFECRQRGLPNKALDGCANDVRSDSQLCGFTLAYMLELCMATPNLLEFDIWSGANLGPLDSRRFWPIPSLDDLRIRGHKTDCDNYPHCMHNELAQMDDSVSPDCQQAKWKAISSIWRYHRFELNPDLKTNTRHWGPPKLRHLCRAVIRQQLVLATHPSFDRKDQCLHENYVRRVHRLPLPAKVKRFLVYEDLWPDSSWLQRIRDWALYKVWNVTYIATHHSSPIFGKGTVFDHGFIPLQDLKEAVVK